MSTTPPDTPRRVALFGATGSIGRQALDVARRHPERLRIAVLAAGRCSDQLIAQALEFRPRRVLIADEAGLSPLREALRGAPEISVGLGTQEMAEAAADAEIDVVLNAVTGARALPISVAAAREGKRLALANKESVVAAGPLLMHLANKNGAEIIPVDSEHSAIFQCLEGSGTTAVRELVLTASGGPFRTRARDTFEAITPAEALKHPTWSMGAKISIDSATMMNKALEIVEARHLFAMPADKIKVAVHPQSVVHSMVVFIDGSVLAQLGTPDMRVPIQYALSWPDRWPADELPGYTAQIFDGLRFEEPDLKAFPSLSFGFEAARRGGLSGAVLNAANEVCVEEFLAGRLSFPGIFDRVGAVLARLKDQPADSLERIQAADTWAREEVHRC